MTARTSIIAMGLGAGLFCLAPPVSAGSSVSFLAGSLLGEVKNSAGVVQMGATVLLYNRFDQLVRQSLTNEQGRFAFGSLAPDVYSIRVTLASFVPAIRRNIQIISGTDKLLEISLATILSTVDIVASPPNHGNLMSDDWKWVLRSAQSTVPVLRFLPDSSGVSTSNSPSISSVFSDTRGMVKFSAGDAESFAGGNQQDLGTAFALVTSIYGSSRLQLSGNLGYAAATGIPTAGFRSTYSRTKDGESGPEITITVRQLYAPSHLAGATATSNGAGSTDGVPTMRTLSLATLDRLDPTDELHLEYGLNMESVTFLERLNYLSPFARATYDLGNGAALKLAFSSGMQPTELMARGGEAGAELNQDLAALALLPRISMLDGHSRVQRTQNIEASYQKIEGSRTWSAGVYSEDVSNAALTMSAFNGASTSRNLMPDLSSNSYILNVGSYSRMGYTASLKQNLGDHLDASVSAGETGVLAADSRLVATTADDFRSLLHEANRPWVSARVAAKLPLSGTRISAGYGWMGAGAIMPPHLSLTQQSNQDVGLNVYIRQPLPAFPGMPGRLEATAELMNMLAQGYLAASVNGQQTLLTDSPRAVRGGLSIIF